MRLPVLLRLQGSNGCTNPDHFLGFGARRFTSICGTRQWLRVAFAVGCAFLLCSASVACSADEIAHKPDVPLVNLALVRFHTLTHAERAMLAFAQVGSVDRGPFAVAGTSANLDDPSNDPAHAGEWNKEREIRAPLIRWLCEEPGAIKLVSPSGLAVLGARIVGRLDLSYVRVPFALAMRKCSITQRIVLTGTEIPHLEFSGSYVSEIDAKGLIVHGDLDLANGFHAAGETRIETARIDGALNCSGGYFHYSNVSLSQYAGADKPALLVEESTIGSDVELNFGFRSEGAVLMSIVSVAHDLDMFGARMSNPHGLAFRCNFSSFGSVWIGSPPVQKFGNFEADGRVDFIAVSVRSGFIVNDARFLGAPGDAHGFFASGLTSGTFLFWRNVQLQNGATVDLSGAHVGMLLDEEKSWPEPGNLLINGLTYDGFGAGSPFDVQSRLRWISLQPPVRGGFEPQPYRQLAKVYRESGLDSEATQVLIAEEDARYARHGLIGRFWGAFLKDTIGYGHRPLRAIFWSLAVVLLGWLAVTVGARAGVMRATWPDSPPPSEPATYEKLHPLLYSLDVFLPFVNLHQERYWWPNADAYGDCLVLNRRLKVSGAFLRYYLWMQVIAGWLLSAIFVAGVTGLMRND